MEDCFYNSLQELKSFTKVFEIYRYQFFRFQIDAEAATGGVLWEKTAYFDGKSAGASPLEGLGGLQAFSSSPQ